MKLGPTLARAPRKDLRFVTPIIAAYVVRTTDDITGQISAAVLKFQEMWRVATMKSGFIRREAGRRRTRWAGAIEVDLLHPRLLGGERKRAFLEAQGIEPDMITSDQRVVVLHAHVVVDCRGHASPDALVADLRASWPGPYRVVAKPILDEATVGDQVDRLLNYASKRRLRYSEAWAGARTRYTVVIEQPWKKFLTAIYESLGEALVISNIHSRSRSTTKRTSDAQIHQCSIEKSDNRESLQLDIQYDYLEKGNNYSDTDENVSEAESSRLILLVHKKYSQQRGGHYHARDRHHAVLQHEQDVCSDARRDHLDTREMGAATPQPGKPASAVWGRNARSEDRAGAPGDRSRARRDREDQGRGGGEKSRSSGSNFIAHSISVGAIERQSSFSTPPVEVDQFNLAIGLVLPDSLHDEMFGPLADKPSPATGCPGSRC